TTLFTTVPNAGTTAHGENPAYDRTFYGIPGTQSLGDVDISEDGDTLYVVNLNDKSLYAYDATQATAAAPLSVTAIPDPGCVGGDWRPAALGVQDGKVFVGGICNAAASQNRA